MRSWSSRALPLAALLVACGARDPEPSAPQWIDLARGFRPRPLEDLALRLEASLEPPRAGRVARRGTPGTESGAAELWFELPLPRASWTDEGGGTWRTPIPTGGALLAAERGALVLLDGEDELKLATVRQPKPGRYSVSDTEIRLILAPDAEPAAVVCRMRLDQGREVDGAWRASQWDLACNGFLVFPDAPETLTCSVPAAMRLGFASVSPNPGGHGAELGATTFRVKLDGRTLFEHEQSFRDPLRSQWHWVELERPNGGPCELVFEIEGGAPALFATPVLAPLAIGEPGKRPWPEARPDLVLVLCDTFRADNLAAWGGAPELAPRLNRFVEGTLHFLDARSAAAWTLPSIATILSGVFPGQHGATDMDRGVSDAVESVAEVLGRAGYRTVALTDSGLFSRHYGQDQGFQWFEEAPVAAWSLKHTLERARQRLADDDGRPLFLVVHTYRVHGPMRVGPDEDLGPWKKLSAEIRDELHARKAADPSVKPMEVALEYVDEGLRFYHDAVSDLDTKVGAWLDELERAGFFERGELVLTADHGNAHGEHRQVGHGSDLYDVKLRVPLAIAGRGIAARAVPGAVSLIDLAPTLAALAGVAPARTWVGRSLLERAPGGPLFAFDFKHNDHQVALYAEGKKLMAPNVAALRDGKPSHAFDLASDPREDRNLAGSLSWPGELGRTLAGSIEPLTVPAAEAKVLELSPEVQEQLKAIGYGE